MRNVEFRKNKRNATSKREQNAKMHEINNANKTHLTRKEYFILYWTVLFYNTTNDNYYLAEEFIARYFEFLFKDGNVDADMVAKLPAPQKEFIEKYLSDREKLATDEEFRKKCIDDREKYAGKNLDKYFTVEEAELNQVDTEFRAIKESNYKY